MSFFLNINSVNVSGLGKDWTVLKVYCNKGPALKMSHSESLIFHELKLNKIIICYYKIMKESME